jgi:serine protease AprX
VIDSGIHGVEDLKDAQGQNRILYNLDSLGGGADDQYGHGTHVAGIIGGNGKNSICSNCDVTIRGIAPSVNIINFHALGQAGQGTDSSVIGAINKAIALKDQYNIRVMNLSLGRPVYESYALDPLCKAVEAAWKAGIVVVVAAGNDGRTNYATYNGYGSITAPGNDPFVITIGAMNTKGTADRSDDVMTSYSSKGPTAIDHIVKPDLVAPGNRVVSLQTGGYLQKNYPGNRPPVSYYQTSTSTGPSGKYFMLSGTSMATAVVSGGAALLLQKNPALTPDQVKMLLMKTAYRNFPPIRMTDAGLTYTLQYDVSQWSGYLICRPQFQQATFPRQL